MNQFVKHLVVSKVKVENQQKSNKKNWLPILPQEKMKNFRFDDFDEFRTYNSLASFSIKNSPSIFVRQNLICEFLLELQKKTSQNKTPVKKGPDEISELKCERFQKVTS